MLFFASPFFEAALSGDWAETGRPQSVSSVITISQPPLVPNSDASLPPQTSEATLVQVESEPEADGAESDAKASDSEAETEAADDEEKERARLESLNKLQSPTSVSFDKGKGRSLDVPGFSAKRRTRHKGPDAVIVLKEEKVRPQANNSVLIF